MIPSTRLPAPEIATVAVGSTVIAATRTELVRGATVTVAPLLVVAPFTVRLANELLLLNGVT